jgi:hypothetical protein
MRSLAFGQNRGGEKRNELGFSWSGRAASFCCHEICSPPFDQIGWLRVFWARCGPGGQRVSWPRPSLHSGNSARAGAGRFRFFGPKPYKNFKVNVFCFFFGKQNN